jgi:hypothetical protein
MIEQVIAKLQDLADHARRLLAPLATFAQTISAVIALYFYASY